MKHLQPLLATCLLSACGSGPNVISPTGDAPLQHPVWVVAHRGGAGLAPENTLAAFSRGIALGADVIELDAHLSMDGVVVVIHDSTVDRTTDGTGRVVDKTLADLQTLNAAAKFNGGSFEPQVVPAFGQVLDLLRGNSAQIEVEIKVPPAGRYPGIETKLIDEVGKRNLSPRVQVSSFNFDVLRDVARTNPELTTVALLGVGFFRAVSIDQPARVIDAIRAVGADRISVNKALLTPALVREAHQRGVPVEVWTVNSSNEMRTFVQMGVDGIISDWPDALIPLVR